MDNTKGPVEVVVVTNSHDERLNSVAASVKALEVLTEAQFVTHRTLLDSQAAQTALALAAADKLTASAFAASEKAIEKAESAQGIYNSGHNDLLRKMDEQHKETLPRTEAEAKHNSMDEKFAEFKKDSERYRENVAMELRSLRESRSEGEGKTLGLAPFMSAIIVGVAALMVFLLERALIK